MTLQTFSGVFTKFLLALSLSLLALAPQAQERSGKRIALVIGNDHYEKVSKLEKAGNDATAMARELKSAGFEVLLHRDLNYRGMVKAVETLANNITGGDQVVVFFAGHGVQIKSGSYLLPVDIEASSESEVEKTAYGLNDLMEKLSDAKAAFTLVMVDACRDNPMKSRGRSVGIARGLLPPDPPKGQMVVYSASKGQQALDSLNDNDKNPNGVFTREFIARMKRPGVRIEDLVREVQESVESLARTVSHDQRPAIYNEARGNFYFFGPTTVQVSPSGNTAPAVRIQSPEEIEQALWNSIKDEREPAVFDEYLKQYPKGRYVAQAKVLLAKLKADNRAPATPTPAPVSVASSEDPETALWTAVGQGNSADDYGVYLKQYPKGKYVALAKQRLQKLKDEAKAQADAADQAAWQAAERAGTEVAYQDYQRQYPNGNYSALVTARLIKARNSAGQREEEMEWQKAQESATRAATQAYIARYPSGKYVAQARLKDAEYQRVPARPSLPFTVDEAMWRTLESSEMYRNFPRPRAMKTRSAYSDTMEYTGSKSRTLTPPAPAARTKETEFSPLGDKCVIHKMKMHYADLGKSFGDNSLTYVCGGVFLGSTMDGKVNAGLKSLGPISGSLYPPKIGAEQRIQHEMAYMPDRKFDSRTTTHCQITGRIEANQLHPRLTGKAWAVRCRSEMAWTGGHDGKPIINDNEDYILEDLGARASELGVLNMPEKRFAIPVPGYQSAIVAEGEYGSRTTSTYSSYDFAVGAPGASSVAFP